MDEAHDGATSMHYGHAPRLRLQEGRASHRFPARSAAGRRQPLRTNDRPQAQRTTNVFKSKRAGRPYPSQWAQSGHHQSWGTNSITNQHQLSGIYLVDTGRRLVLAVSVGLDSQVRCPKPCAGWPNLTGSFDPGFPGTTHPLALLCLQSANSPVSVFYGPLCVCVCVCVCVCTRAERL